MKNDIRFPEHIRRFDDLPFQFETFVCAKRVAILSEAYYCYRQDRPGQDISVRDERFFVHFELFDWLEGRLKERMTTEIETQLYRAELCSHIWALSRIDKLFKRRYLRAALAHLNRPLCHLKSFDKIAIGRSINDKAQRLVLYSLVQPLMRAQEETSEPADSLMLPSKNI